MNSKSPQTIPQNWYNSPEIFELERDQIFRKHWWLVAQENQLAEPGDYLAITVFNLPLIVTRDQQGELRGFHNVCRHRAGPLVRDGSGNCREFTCRYHAWRYDSTGNLLKTPGLRRDEEIDYSQFSLFPIRVTCWNSMVFVCLDEQAPDLQNWLGDIVKIAESFPRNSSMSFLDEVEVSGKANWKAYGDNSCEGYHVGMVHKDLGDSMVREKVKIDGYPNGEFVGFDVSYESSGGDHTRDGKAFWIYKFPGLLLHFGEYSFNAESVFPIGTDSILLKRWFWVDNKEAKKRGINPADMQASSEQVMGEDLEICELVQRNLNTGVYQTGHLSPREEVGTIFFQQLVRQALEPI